MKLVPNIGSADKVIRLLLSMFLIVLFYRGALTGVFGVIALIAAMLLAVTTLISFCPIYRVFKLNSIFKYKKKD